MCLHFRVIAKYALRLKGRTNSMCQNTDTVDCFPGRPINCHKCQSESNYSYLTATFGTQSTDLADSGIGAQLEILKGTVFKILLPCGMILDCSTESAFQQNLGS